MKLVQHPTTKKRSFETFYVSTQFECAYAVRR